MCTELQEREPELIKQAVRQLLATPDWTEARLRECLRTVLAGWHRDFEELVGVTNLSALQAQLEAYRAIVDFVVQTRPTLVTPEALLSDPYVRIWSDHLDSLLSRLRAATEA